MPEYHASWVRQEERKFRPDAKADLLTLEAKKR